MQWWMVFPYRKLCFVKSFTVSMTTEKCSRVCFLLYGIPHHGSNGSINITNFFDDGCHLVDLTVTTAKRSSSLPTPETLSYYASFRIEADSTDTAIWSISVDTLNATITQIDEHKYLS